MTDENSHAVNVIGGLAMNNAGSLTFRKYCQMPLHALLVMVTFLNLNNKTVAMIMKQYLLTADSLHFVFISCHL